MQHIFCLHAKTLHQCKYKTDYIAKFKGYLVIDHASSDIKMNLTYVLIEQLPLKILDERTATITTAPYHIMNALNIFLHLFIHSYRNIALTHIHCVGC